MAMVSADGSSQSFGGLTAQIGWFDLRVGGHPALSLHSSNEPGELTQWLCHDDSTINIVVVIIIIIIIDKNVGWNTARHAAETRTLTKADKKWCLQDVKKNNTH